MRVFCVEGEIGAGKTQLLYALADHLRGRGIPVVTVPEPVELWRQAGILQLFYSDPARYGYMFQSYVYTTRIQAICNAVDLSQDRRTVYLLERSPATDQIFMHLQRLSDVEREMYATWCHVHDMILPFGLEDVTVLYLKTSLPECMRRVRLRHREGEVIEQESPHDASATGGVSIEYQAALRRAHEAFFEGQHAEEFKGMPKSPFRTVLTIEAALADADFCQPGEVRDRILAEVASRMGFK